MKNPEKIHQKLENSLDFHTPKSAKENTNRIFRDAIADPIFQ